MFLSIYLSFFINPTQFYFLSSKIRIVLLLCIFHYYILLLCHLLVSWCDSKVIHSFLLLGSSFRSSSLSKSFNDLFFLLSCQWFIFAIVLCNPPSILCICINQIFFPSLFSPSFIFSITFPNKDWR